MNENIDNTSKTTLYSLDKFESSLVRTTIKEVCEALREKDTTK